MNSDVRGRLNIPVGKATLPETRAFLERLASCPEKQARIRETMDRALEQRRLMKHRKSRKQTVIKEAGA